MKKKRTKRGFPYYEFKDFYSNDCTVILSSLAEHACIWVGLSGKPELVRMGDKGWEEYKIPDEVSINHKMLLTQENAKNLIPILQKFVETGDL